MFRLLLVLATLVITVDGSSASAQGRGWFKHRGVKRAHSSHGHSRHNRYQGYSANQAYAGPSLFGFSFGFGSGSPPGYTAGYPDPYFLDTYGLDPWARGSFRAPDLLDDPYFYDRVPYQHRRTPGRYSQQRVPQERYRAIRPAVRYEMGDSILAATQESTGLVRSLRTEGQRLYVSFKDYKQGDQWNDYLAPHHLAELAQSGNNSDLKMLLDRFDGVISNPQLHAVAGVEGFIETRNMLSQYLSETTQSAPQPSEIPAVAPLPVPPPEPQPESIPVPSQSDQAEV